MRNERHYCSQLRHRLSLQQEVVTPDDAGGFTRGWEEVAKLWAEIRPITGNDRFSASAGKEVLLAGQMQTQVSHRVYLRWREGVTAAMRLVFDGRAFNIRYVAQLGGDKEMLELLVQEGVAE